MNFLEKYRTRIVFAALIVLTLCVYWQAVGFEFVNFDDNIYVYQNRFVTDGLTRTNIYWAFTAFHSANWHPLTWLSHQLDAQLFGINAGSHHATNIVLHLINTLLSFSVFRKFTGSFWKSAVVAGLFAVHPAHVESVAWVAERKDVLSTMFWMLTMLAYLRFVRAKGTGDKDQPAEPEDGKRSSRKRSAAFMLGVAGLFALGLMAKPMLVTLPFVLLLMDFWPLARLQKPRDLIPLLIEKIPLFFLSAASAVITLMAQKAAGAVQSLEMLPFGTRLLNAVVAYSKYVLELFYPVNLAAWYPYEQTIPMWQVGGAALLLGVISAFGIWQVARRKYLIVGWLWFLGTLVPVIGLVQVGLQSMADRYTYVPFFGLLIMVVWGAGDLFKKLKVNQAIVASATIAVLLVLTALSFRQASYWRNDETLYRHSIAVTNGNFLLMQNYCHWLTQEERLGEAEQQCRDSIAANPKYADAYNSLGIIQIKLQQYNEAAETFQAAAAADPGFAMYKVNHAIALSQLGKPDEAEQKLQEAAAVISYTENTRIWIDAIKNLAIAYARQNNFTKAEENFARVLAIAPDNFEIRSNYALTLYADKKYDDAQRQIEEAIRQKPEKAEAFAIYGSILMAKNAKDEAIKQFERALELDPNLTEARKRLSDLRNEEKRK